ncbi:MAG: hypothetical protein JG782_1868 [Anaerophaga sp.]|nr:hypothetical protein [Anaerophaga sp.]
MSSMPRYGKLFIKLHILLYQQPDNSISDSLNLLAIG